MAPAYSVTSPSSSLARLDLLVMGARLLVNALCPRAYVSLPQSSGFVASDIGEGDPCPKVNLARLAEQPYLEPTTVLALPPRLPLPPRAELGGAFQGSLLGGGWFA